jgi:hypothetical protein
VAPWAGSSPAPADGKSGALADTAVRARRAAEEEGRWPFESAAGHGDRKDSVLRKTSCRFLQR